MKEIKHLSDLYAGQCYYIYNKEGESKSGALRECLTFKGMVLYFDIPSTPYNLDILKRLRVFGPVIETPDIDELIKPSTDREID